MAFNNILLLILLNCFSYAKTSVLFSPHQGEEAFEKIYNLSAGAKKKLFVTAYSWSDKKVLDAMIDALGNGAEVKVIVHPSLANTSRIKDYLTKLEEAGGEAKIAAMNMHEKIFIIDDQVVINSSANLSGGAKNKYSENFVFHEIESQTEKDLLAEFNNEFSVMWNTGRDFKSGEEQNALVLPINDIANEPSTKEVRLLSSSMNFSLKNNSPTTVAYKSGKQQALVRKGTWVVRDAIIKEINNAKENIFVSINHLNIREVSDALVEAVRRGVDVRLAVDNQEFKTAPNNKEMTPQFVKDWKSIEGNKDKEVPVRVKFYSFAPSPRYWFLNHHKYLLIDFNEDKLEQTILISGSYNISKTAEQNQFDNMVIYKGIEYVDLYRDFKKEFDHLWSLNRDERDGPLEEIYNSLTSVYKDSLAIHSDTPISLAWAEVLDIRKKVYKIAPGMFKNLFRKRDCRYFNIVKSEFYGCPTP